MALAGSHRGHEVGLGSEPRLFFRATYYCYCVASNYVMYTTDVAQIPSAFYVCASFFNVLFVVEAQQPHVSTCNFQLLIHELQIDKKSLEKCILIKLKLQCLTLSYVFKNKA